MKHICIVEKDARLGKLVQKRLAGEGYYVDLVQDGESALRYVQKNRCNLLLLGMDITRVGAREVLEYMQQNDALRRIPIIVLSNSGEKRELADVQELGARDWIIKTEFDLEEVVRKVRAHVDFEA